LQAGSLVGRNVLAPVDTGYLAAGSSIRGRVELPSSASSVEITVTDQYGQQVRTLNLGSHPSGQLEFTWDGINNNGEYAQPGNYRIAVNAVRGFTNEQLQTQLYNRVDSVTMGSGASGLTLNLAGSGQLPFAQVTAIQ
jgi:flagellar basal-body rod modification protein FlgD